ncbi:MAG: hypothetical protein AAGF11_45260 [Myxococcota bacterium]
MKDGDGTAIPGNGEPALRTTEPELILVNMAASEAQDLAQEPIVIHRSVNRDGQTFALAPLSRERVKEHFGDRVHLYPRVFIAHETAEDYHSIRGGLAVQVVHLLTGVPTEHLDKIGGVCFLDPVTGLEAPWRDG